MTLNSRLWLASTVLVLAGLLMLPAAQAAEAAAPVTPGHAPVDEYTADGRLPLAAIMRRFETLATEHGWVAETIYAYPGMPDVAIRSWRTPHRGEALWILSGIHGEEPAGPNAIADNLASLTQLAASGVPIVLIPLANPKPRAAAAPGPETEALTRHVLRLVELYPPRLVLDLHEDELSREGGYIYSQGRQAEDNPAGAEIVRLLQSSGIPLRQSGKTRFGETIVQGVISRDDQGGPIRDGSIDELLAATEVFVDGKRVRGPSAHTVIVVETPAFAGSQFALRVAAQGAVVQHAAALWRAVEPPR